MKPRTLKTKVNQKTVDKVVLLVDAIADDAYCVECMGAEIEEFLISTACRLQMIEGLIYTRAQK
jgi:hypothetical protein